jgi:aldose 1-epimerase
MSASPIVLGSAPGPVLHLLTLGATVHRLEVTCGDGVRRNVVLGHPTPEDYLASTYYLGATVGRYANRIAGGRFPLDGREIQVAVQDRGNCLHGGPDGFDSREWAVVDGSDTHVVLELVSPDGDQGFPGRLNARVRYDVAGDQVDISYEATTDAPTVVNLTNHTYFNLDGNGTGVVDDHLLTVTAEQYLPVDRTGIPLGEYAAVAGTPFDFRAPAPIGRAARGDDEQVMRAQGIDHNYVIDGAGLRAAAVLESSRTRTRLVLETDRPGLQVYTGNHLDGSRRGSDGSVYRQGDGIALEPQLFPDSPNHPEWSSPVLRPGETYSARLRWTVTPAPRPAR